MFKDFIYSIKEKQEDSSVALLKDLPTELGKPWIKALKSKKDFIKEGYTQTCNHFTCNKKSYHNNTFCFQKLLEAAARIKKSRNISEITIQTDVVELVRA